MKIYLFILVMMAATLGVSAQKSATPDGKQIIETTKNFDAEIALAKLTLKAHGGEKLKAMSSLVVKGSVDVTTSAIAQAIPATFVTVFSGDKYRLEITTISTN